MLECEWIWVYNSPGLNALIWQQYSMRQSQAVLQTGSILLVTHSAAMHTKCCETQKTHLITIWNVRMSMDLGLDYSLAEFMDLAAVFDEIVSGSYADTIYSAGSSFCCDAQK
jgi:hypothetical protein